MSTFETEQSARPTNVRWAVFGLAFGASMLLYIHRYAFGQIKPQLQKEWNLSDTELGVLDSISSGAYSLLQFPMGVSADVFGVHLVLSILILAWSGGLGMHAWAPNYAALWWARVTLGAGQSAAFACVNSISRTWYPASIRTTLQGLTGVTAGRLGGACAGLLFATVMIAWMKLDWRTAVWILTGVGLVHGLLFALIYRNSPRSHPLVNEAEANLIEGHSPGARPAAPRPRMPVKQMLASLSPRSLLNLIAVNLQTILSTLADNVYSHWTPLFLAKVYLFEAGERGLWSSLPLLGGAAGGIVGGVLNDRIIQRTGNRRWARRIVAIAGKGIAGLVLLLALVWFEQPYVFCTLLIFVKFFTDWSLTSNWGTITDIGGRATATVFSFNNSVAGIGSVGAGVFFGSLADNFGWKVVFVTVAVTYLLCAAVWFLIDCTIPLLAEKPSDAEAAKSKDD